MLLEMGLKNDFIEEKKPELPFSSWMVGRKKDIIQCGSACDVLDKGAVTQGTHVCINAQADL